MSDDVTHPAASRVAPAIASERAIFIYALLAGPHTTGLANPGRRRIWRLRSVRIRGISADQDEVSPSVLGPCRLIVTRVKRALLAIADGANARTIEAERHQVLLRGVGTTVAECQVVLLGSALVAMTLDEE